MIVGNIYSFGKSCGFVQNSIIEFSLESFVLLNKSLGIKCVEIPMDVFFDSDDKIGLLNFLNFLDRYKIDLFPALENYSYEYMLFLNDAGIFDERKFVRVKLSKFYGGNRHLNEDLYTSSIENFESFMELIRTNSSFSNIRFLVENHQDISYLDIDYFINKYPDHVGITWDTGNTITCGLTIDRFLERYSRSIYHVHLKDYRIIRDNHDIQLQRCILGQGYVSLDKIIKELHTKVSFSIELGAHHKRFCNISNDSWWFGFDTSYRDEVLDFIFSHAESEESSSGNINLDLERCEYIASLNTFKSRIYAAINN